MSRPKVMEFKDVSFVRTKKTPQQVMNSLMKHGPKSTPRKTGKVREVVPQGE